MASGCSGRLIGGSQTSCQKIPAGAPSPVLAKSQNRKVVIGRGTKKIEVRITGLHPCVDALPHTQAFFDLNRAGERPIGAAFKKRQIGKCITVWHYQDLKRAVACILKQAVHGGLQPQTFISTGKNDFYMFHESARSPHQLLHTQGTPAATRGEEAERSTGALGEVLPKFSQVFEKQDHKTCFMVAAVLQLFNRRAAWGRLREKR